MKAPFPAYRGDDDFVFTCYSHQDAAAVYEDIHRLHKSGVNVWYDEGIRPGSEWTDELANAIRNCKTLLFFVTPNAIQSKHCRDEIQYAIKADKPVIVIYLQPTELPPGLDLTLGALHAVVKGQHHDDERYFELLTEAIREPVALHDSSARSGPTRPPDATTRRRVEPARRNATRYAGYTALIVLGAVIAAGGYRLTRQPASTPVPKLIEHTNSVALMPFENRGGFETGSYLPESLAEDLLNRLVAIEGLRVASRRASFAYAAQADLDLVSVATALGVSSVIVGYVRKSGDLIRLSLELIDVSSGTEMVRWSHSYDNRPLDQVLSIQTDATVQIARTFFPEGLSGANEQRLARVSTQSPEAYDYYLRARELLRRPVAGSTNLEDAARLFNLAIALDGEYAWARAGLCATHTLAYEVRSDVFEAAERSCEALAGYREDLFEVRFALGDYYRITGKLDDALTELESANVLNRNSADARLALANVLLDQFELNKDQLDLVRAEEAYLEAIAIEPSYWFTHHSYAKFLARRSRLKDAAHRLEQALSLEPESVSSRNNLAAVQYRMGLTEEAEGNWRQSLLITTENRWAYEGLGLLCFYSGQFDEAIDAFRRAIEITPGDHSLWGRLGEAYKFAGGKQAEAEQAFRKGIELVGESLRINPRNWETYGHLALYRAYVGDFAAAEQALQRTFELNPSRNFGGYLWAALIANEMKEIDRVFENLDAALESGLDEEIRFLTEEPAFANLRANHEKRYHDLLDRYAKRTNSAFDAETRPTEY